MILQWDESFDIGSDTLTGVNDADYQPPFPLTAQLNKLTIKPDRPQSSPEDIKKLKEGMKQAALASNNLVLWEPAGRFARERPANSPSRQSSPAKLRLARQNRDAGERENVAYVG